MKAKIPDRARFDISWLAAKPRIVEKLRQTIQPKSIEFIEEYATPAEPKAEEVVPAAPAAPAEEPKAAETPAKGHEHPHAEGSGHAHPKASE